VGFLSRIPSRVRIALAVASGTVLLVCSGYLFLGSGNESTVKTPPATFIPTDRDLREDPTAIIKKKDLEATFKVTFRQFQQNPVKSQGVQYNYTETNGAFTVSVLEVKGQEAAANWQRLITTFKYPDAPDIGPQVKFKPDLVIAVYKGEVFVSVTLVSGQKPTDGKALHTLGKLAFKKTPA